MAKSQGVVSCTCIHQRLRFPFRLRLGTDFVPILDSFARVQEPLYFVLILQSSLQDAIPKSGPAACECPDRCSVNRLLSRPIFMLSSSVGFLLPCRLTLTLTLTAFIPIIERSELTSPPGKPCDIALKSDLSLDNARVRVFRESQQRHKMTAIFI